MGSSPVFPELSGAARFWYRNTRSPFSAVPLRMSAGMRVRPHSLFRHDEVGDTPVFPGTGGLGDKHCSRFIHGTGQGNQHIVVAGVNPLHFSNVNRASACFFDGLHLLGTGSRQQHASQEGGHGKDFIHDREEIKKVVLYSTSTLRGRLVLSAGAMIPRDSSRSIMRAARP